MRRASIRRANSDVPAPSSSGPLREYVGLRDLGDCLLEAYESVARRAHERFLERGAQAGGELEDWLAAERELLHLLSVHIKDTGDVVYALACVPSLTGAGLSIGIEASWLAIVVQPDAPGTDCNETMPADIQEMFHALADEPVGGHGCHQAIAPYLNDGATSSARAFSIQQLPAPVDPVRSVAVFSKGVLGIRMPKLKPVRNS